MLEVGVDALCYLMDEATEVTLSRAWRSKGHAQYDVSELFIFHGIEFHPLVVPELLEQEIYFMNLKDIAHPSPAIEKAKLKGMDRM